MQTTIILTTKPGFSIKSSLESLFRQTVLPNKIVVVDDGAMWADAADIIGFNVHDIVGTKSYVMRDHEIQITAIRAAGNISTRYNTAINMTHATTNIWGFLKAGDRFVDSKIEKSIAAFNVDPVILAVVSDSSNKMYNCYEGHRLNLKPDYDYCVMIKKDAFMALNSLFDINLNNNEYWNILTKISSVGLIYHIPESLHEIFHE